VYEYVCRTCGISFRCDVREDEVLCLRCTNWAHRVWGFSIAASFPGNRAHHASELARASEKASQPQILYDAHGEAHTVERPEHRYVPVDLRDRDALGVTGEGLPATYDHLRRIGNDPAADRLRKAIE